MNAVFGQLYAMRARVHTKIRKFLLFGDMYSGNYEKRTTLFSFHFNSIKSSEKRKLPLRITNGSTYFMFVPFPLLVVSRTIKEMVLPICIA